MVQHICVYQDDCMLGIFTFGGAKMKIPPYCKMCKGFQIMAYFPKQKRYWGDAWVPINSSYGYPYTYKGFAINKAKHILNWNRNADAYMQIIDLQTGGVVWESENMKEVTQ